MDEWHPEIASQLASLKTADRRTLKVLFRTLQPPNLLQLEGEYEAALLQQGGPIVGWLMRATFRAHGKWIGKAFRASDAQSGEGYNYFQKGDSIQQKLFMDIRIEESQFESGPSMMIDYRKKNWGPIRWLDGEVRQVIPGLLLGFGTLGPRLGGNNSLRRRIPFAMYGPIRPYQLLESNHQVAA